MACRVLYDHIRLARHEYPSLLVRTRFSWSLASAVLVGCYMRFSLCLYHTVVVARSTSPPALHHRSYGRATNSMDTRRPHRCVYVYISIFRLDTYVSLFILHFMELAIDL
jgi:hypothetical protein